MGDRRKRGRKRRGEVEKIRNMKIAHYRSGGKRRGARGKSEEKSWKGSKRRRNIEEFGRQRRRKQLQKQN